MGVTTEIGTEAASTASNVATSDLSTEVKIALITVLVAIVLVSIIVWYVKRAANMTKHDLEAGRSDITPDMSEYRPSAFPNPLTPDDNTNYKRSSSHSITISVTEHESQDTRALLARDGGAINHVLSLPSPTTPRPGAYRIQTVRYG